MIFLALLRPSEAVALPALTVPSSALCPLIYYAGEWLGLRLNLTHTTLQVLQLTYPETYSQPLAERGFVCPCGFDGFSFPIFCLLGEVLRCAPCALPQFPFGGTLPLEVFASPLGTFISYHISTEKSSTFFKFFNFFSSCGRGLTVRSLCASSPSYLARQPLEVFASSLKTFIVYHTPGEKSSTFCKKSKNFFMQTRSG